jgi:hypothetical protein
MIWQVNVATSPPPSEPPIQRFSALVKRELGADDVRILDAADAPSPATNVLYAPLAGGRQVAVTFVTAPDNPPALLRRLEILARTFAHALEDTGGDGRVSRPPVSASLHDELKALARRAQAIDAMVLDAHSPVVWGSAHAPVPQRHAHTSERLLEPLERLEESRRELLRVIHEIGTEPNGVDGDDEDDAEKQNDGVPPAPVSVDLLADNDDSPDVSHRAIQEVRELPGIPALRRGRPLLHVVREDAFGYVARSFAGIYLLVLVFDAPFDELRAERALVEAMPRIEGLVLALPPLDPGPAPTANVIAFRRRRR